MGSQELENATGNAILLCGATVSAFNSEVVGREPFFYRIVKIEAATASFIVRSGTGNDYRIKVEQISGKP